MHINELFVGIQGEGQTIGFPAYFVRTSGCNLRCPDCDTDYSFTEKGKDYTIKELMDAFYATGLNTIVMTGGEPLLQWDDIKALLYKVVGKLSFKRMIIETNGTLCPSTNVIYPYMYLVVSPKFYSPNSYSKDILCTIFQKVPQAELKILFFEKDQLFMAKEILKRFTQEGITLKYPVTFQPGIPLGMPDKEIPTHLKYLSALYMKYIGALPTSRFIVQQHKWIWGSNKRGV